MFKNFFLEMKEILFCDFLDKETKLCKENTEVEHK